MPASITIITAVLIGAVLIALAVLRWPIYALVAWVIASVVLHEYVLFPDATVLRLQLSQILLAGLLLGFGIRWILRFAPSVTPGNRLTSDRGIYRVGDSIWIYNRYALPWKRGQGPSAFS